MLGGKIEDVGGQALIKRARKLCSAAGNDQVVVAGQTGIAYQIVAYDISSTTAGAARLHFGAVADIASKGIGGGVLAASAHDSMAFGFSGPQGLPGEALNISAVTTTNAEVFVHYIERRS